MGISNQLREIKAEVKEPGQASKVNDQTKSALNNSLNKLAKKLFQAVENDEIKITDTRDMKDVVAMYQMLNQDADTADTRPAITADVAQFIKVSTGVDADAKGAAKQVERSVDTMNEEQVQAMIENYGKAKDHENAETFGD